MTVPLPSQGSTSWYAWASDIHTKANTPASGLTVDGSPVSTLDISSTAPSLGGLAGPLPGAFARMYASSTGQTLASTSITQIALNTVEHSDGSYFSADTTAPGAIRVEQAGRYLVNYSLKLIGGTLGQRIAALQVDWGGVIREAGIASATDATIPGSAVLALTAFQYVALFGYVDGGTSVSVNSGSIAYTGLTVTYLGPPQ